VYAATTIDETYKIKHFTIGKRKRYSIMEAFTLYHLLGAKKFHAVDPKLWVKLYSNEVLPSRSIDSMKSFWKNYCNVTFEDFLIESIHINRDYTLTH
jgi:hypothetical protein